MDAAKAIKRFIHNLAVRTVKATGEPSPQSAIATQNTPSVQKAAVGVPITPVSISGSVSGKAIEPQPTDQPRNAIQPIPAKAGDTVDALGKLCTSSASTV